MKKKSLFYTSEQLALIDPLRIPKHIAMIPDGNRRWAKRKHSSVEEGHRQGADNLMDIVKAAKEIGIEVLTFFTFSTENWSRPKGEVDVLMWLLQNYLFKQRAAMIENGIRFHTIGEISRLPVDLINIIDETKAATESCSKINLVLALNYGGRDEISRAVKKIAADIEAKKIKNDEITEEMISRYLDTHSWLDPDLLIRTSGELRVSNFLLWQISYAEIYIANALWPDFSPSHLLEAILDFQKRERRLGGA